MVIESRDIERCGRSSEVAAERPEKQVRDILPEVFRGLGIEARIEEVRLGEEWASVVGELVASRSRPGEIRDGTLFVEVENNVWMQEIRFHRKKMIERIRERFPGLGVKGIRLVIERERS